MKRRNTPAKEAVMRVLTQAGKPLSHETIGQKAEVPMDRATVYRVLNRFCEDGVVHRIIAEDGKQYFAICTNCGKEKAIDYHFHFRCLGCQTIECLKESVHFSIPQGYKFEGVNAMITGYCNKCG